MTMTVPETREKLPEEESDHAMASLKRVPFGGSLPCLSQAILTPQSLLG
jgi:hypothetical protein